MSRPVEVAIVVEGYAEQTFIRDVLGPHLAAGGIYLRPALIGKPGHKGGRIQFNRAARDIRAFLLQRSDVYVATMFDYYRIDPEWPGRPEVKEHFTAMQKARALEGETLARMQEMLPDLDISRRFLPYVAMHEFEALLFSDARVLANALGVQKAAVLEILDACGEPEEIDDAPQTAPSKRLARLVSGYRKVAMGKTIAEAIGIPCMRDKCPHFNEWLQRIEALPPC